MARFSQFTFFTPEAAAAYLAQYEGPFAADKSGDTHLDRIAAERRLLPVTTAEEREAARRYAKAHPFTMRPWE